MIAQTQNLSMPNCGGYYVLIVEDSPVDFEIMSRAFRKIKFSPCIHHCEDGDKALNFLEMAADGQLPDGKPLMVLLDLNLPGTDGRQVLSSMKSHEQLKKIPVIILSTSQNDGDLEFCYNHGANKYLNKPLTATDFVHTAKEIKDFWEDRIITQSSTRTQ
ncbi:MAG TPA: response regulator [Alphaproteobacteria bacterium]|nr:response regulator [Alphaproteobacteria bacterium]HNS43856.1 response regulator [Alphaproteobacteria bacterium]